MQGSINRENENDNLIQSLLSKEISNIQEVETEEEEDEEEQEFGKKLWIETKKLWLIVGPSIFSRVASFTMNVVTQAFSGHLGEVQLAAMSIANTVIVGFNFGLLVSPIEQIIHSYIFPPLPISINN
jgi:MATE family multidrug resistance protein